MNELSLEQQENTPTSNKFLPAILLLFFGSGCAALIYEVVWFQLLQLVIGSSAVSLGVLLGIYMGGMCLGSLTFPRIVSARRNPLRAYAIIELLIGICGIAVLFAVHNVDKFYISHAGPGFMGVFMRGAVCAMCLLPPTFLMGATLPAIARWVESTPKGISWLGTFYAGNIIGAVFGCLLAGFYLLRVHDMYIATYTALGFNILVAVAGLILADAAEYKIPLRDIGDRAFIHVPGSWTVYFVIAISGFTALGAEVVWTRLLSLMLGATVYSFSIILAVFLVGLGIGSSIGALISGSMKRPRLALGVCQLLLCAAVGWSAFIISKSLPYWPIDPSISSSPWYTFQLDILRCIWTLLPAACLWGASFPLALASVVSTGQDSGRIVGGVYASNTVGAIFGSLVFSMVVVPNLGTQQSQRIIMALSAISAFIMLLPVLWPFGEREWFTGKPKKAYSRFIGVVSLTASVAIIVMLIWTVSAIPWGAIAYGRFMATMGNTLVPGITTIDEMPKTGSTSDTYCIYAGEGKNVSIAVSRTPAGRQSFHGAGKVQASNDPLDMKLQRMLGHISALLNKNPKNVLVVACGAGVTAGSFVPHPEVEKIVIVDIEPLVPKEVAPRFSTENFSVVTDPRTQVVIDDGRHYIHTTKEKFDVITSDPIDPWVKGCAALNTIEYYKMCREHLNPGGVMALWMPFYESSEETTKSLITTFFEVFPEGIIWSNDDYGQGYDAVLFGQVGGTEINIDELQAKLNDASHAAVNASLQQVGFNSAAELLASYAGQASELKEWSKGAQINWDKNLRLQYIAGMWLNSYIEKDILNNILKYYTFPKNIFKGSEENITSLKQRLEATGRRETN
ncbi:MAG: fused MFS/spermidine synthase [Sedimentisphaerales bacterium]|nr:fused MFS/spermidine synthase [Sedimentisphaerales bacterium]